MVHKKIPWADEVAEAIHTHVEADITDLEHDAQKIKGKTVDDSAIGDGKVLTFKSASGKIEYETPAASGDMLKSVYDIDEDGVVDNSEKLEGSTKAQVQDHAPKAHTHPCSDLTDHTKTTHDTLNIDADTLDSMRADEFATDAELSAHAAQESAHHTKFTITEHDTTDRHILGTVVPHDALASLTEKSHTSLTDKGTNTHAQIDTHLVASAPHSGHEVTSAKGAVNGYCPLDASQLVPLANIPATLTGKDADTVDTLHASAFAVAAKGVTNGDSHDHDGGDGAQIDHTKLSNIGTNTHAQVDTFIASKGQASGLCDLDAGSKVPTAKMPSGTVAITLTFSVPDTLTTGQKKQRLLAPCAITLTKVRLVVDTAPTGANLIVDVHTGPNAGTTIFTTQANRPTIVAGSKTGVSVAPDVTAIAEGTEFSVYVDAIGTTIAGSDLTIEVIGVQAVVFS